MHKICFKRKNSILYRGELKCYCWFKVPQMSCRHLTCSIRHHKFFFPVNQPFATYPIRFELVQSHSLCGPGVSSSSSCSAGSAAASLCESSAGGDDGVSTCFWIRTCNMTSSGISLKRSKLRFRLLPLQSYII